MQFIKPHNFINSSVSAFFTTKTMSSNFYEPLKDSGFPEESIYMPLQKHTDHVMILEDDFKPRIADAILTGRKGVLIGVQVADCVPVLLLDEGKSVIGAVHAGWRGTSSGILKKTINAMKERFGVSAQDILIAIGPSIRQCCYNVGDEVKEAVHKATGEGGYYFMQNEKYLIDLSNANRLQALSAGVLEKNIWQSEECTFCKPAKFHSFRYAKDRAGRQGGFIGML
ncbi:MAG: peptidoglycan editing factor PgeF [Nitrospirae bacterium]|nr:peptidoglycan editing factor PgeF [Nitrospirota bacterium]